MVAFKIFIATMHAILTDIMEQLWEFVKEYKYELSIGTYDVYATIGNLMIGSFYGVTAHESKWHLFKTSTEIDFVHMQ